MRKKQNLFREISNQIPEEIFETLIETQGLKLERIVSLGQVTSSGEWLSQDKNEWVILLKGRAKFLFEDDVIAMEMGPGDYVHIPADCKHRVEWTDPEQKTVWLALHYD